MNFQQIKSNFFQIFGKKKENSSQNSLYQKMRGFLSRLSSSFFIVIAIMPFAGLLLGVGALLGSFQATRDAAVVFSTLGGCFFGNMGIFFALAIIVGFNKDVVATISCLFAYFIFIASQFLFLTIQNPEIASWIASNESVQHINVLFYHNIGLGIANSNLGIISLNTGVIGGIAVGAVTHLTFNKFKNTKLPSFICFFEGKRFVPLVIIPVAMTLSLSFLIVWPIINIIFDAIGKGAAFLPYGIASGIVTAIWRLLTPFGLHHAFYTTFWWTSAGGQIQMNYWMRINGQVMTVAQYLQSIHVKVPGTVSGDSNIWFFMSRNGIPFNTEFFSSYDPSTQILSGRIAGIHPGQFTGVNYPFMIGGYVGAGIAMYQMAKPESKKQALSLIVSGVATSVLIGVTEPMIFMYIFIAPLLFFGFHVIMSAIGAIILWNLNCHIGASFSCGLLDLMIYGALQTKLGTNWYMALIPIVIYVPIYYIVFLLYMKKTKKIFPFFETNELGKTINLADKETYRSQIGINIEDLVIGLGGRDNLEKIDNCATRLRLVVKNNDIVNDKLLRTTGAIHIIKTGKDLQVIYGPKAQTIAQKLSDYVKNPSIQDDSVKNINTSKNSTEAKKDKTIKK